MTVMKNYRSIKSMNMKLLGFKSLGIAEIASESVLPNSLFNKYSLLLCVRSLNFRLKN
jgi:hypothetical protein